MSAVHCFLLLDGFSVVHTGHYHPTDDYLWCSMMKEISCYWLHQEFPWTPSSDNQLLSWLDNCTLLYVSPLRTEKRITDPFSDINRTRHQIFLFYQTVQPLNVKNKALQLGTFIGVSDDIIERYTGLWNWNSPSVLSIRVSVRLSDFVLF